MTLDRLATDPRVTVRSRGTPDPDGEAIVYWMQRAQRALDNPALDIAIALGNTLNKPVVVFFGLNPFVHAANLRHYQFLADGLPEIAVGLRTRRVAFVFRRYPAHRLLPFLEEVRPVMLVGDDNPLRQMAQWRDTITQHVRVPFWTVDADVVVPTQLVEGEQYAARTIRPRLQKHIAAFLEPTTEHRARVVWAGQAEDAVPLATEMLDGMPIDRSVSPVAGSRGGMRAARRRLKRFVTHTLAEYAHDRNHPEDDGTSLLSPYLHFGHIGPREVARAVQSANAPSASIDAFIEQLVVRRELAINFVAHNDAYDRLEGCERWARRTLHQHRFDRRPHVYTAEQFEAAETHDPLWNAAQRQMVSAGWMHGYVRMYWAKKILEWSLSPEEAFATAVRLNDKYELDGRDPNGYANIAWAIGGKHDRPWPTRPVYGAIRSMSFASTSRKFDSARYIARFSS
jgi:deoxyribodipyrimidine photo-lyase